MMTNPSKPSSLKNLGKASDERLAHVGIETVDDLRRVGSVEAYRRVKAAFPRETTNTMLWALEGALLNVIFTELPLEIKTALLEELKGL